MNELACHLGALLVMLPGLMVSLYVLSVFHGLQLSVIPVAIVNSDIDPELPEVFLATLPNYTMVQSAYANLDRAKTAMERKEVLGIISIPENFSTALRHRFSETGDFDESPIYIDFDSVHDNRQIGFILQKIIFDSLEVSNARSHECIFADCENSVGRSTVTCVSNKLINAHGPHFRHFVGSSILGITRELFKKRSRCFRDIPSLNFRGDRSAVYY